MIRSFIKTLILQVFLIIFQAYSMLMCVFLYVFRLPGAEGTRLQSRHMLCFRDLWGFDCSGDRQPRREDHPRWRRPLHHPETRMFIFCTFATFHTVFCLKFSFVVVLSHILFDISWLNTEPNHLCVPLWPPAGAVGSVWYADRWQPL